MNVGSAKISMRRAIHSLVLAVILWGLVSNLSFGLWIVWATNFSPDVPADYPFAYITNHAQERSGQLTHQEAECRIEQAWNIGFQWAVDRARRPLGMSAATIPLFAALLYRRKKRHPVPALPGS